MKRYFDTVTNLYPFFFFGSFKKIKKKCLLQFMITTMFFIIPNLLFKTHKKNEIKIYNLLN